MSEHPPKKCHLMLVGYSLLLYVYFALVQKKLERKKKKHSLCDMKENVME